MSKTTIFIICLIISVLICLSLLIAVKLKNSRTKLVNFSQGTSHIIDHEMLTQQDLLYAAHDTMKHFKYILQWTSPNISPFVYMGTGQNGFIAENCPHINCFVTHDRKLLGDITAFDVIVFAGPEIVRANPEDLPQKRSPHQKYAYGTIESADNYPICNPIFDGFFNWTWTYKLDSDSRWGYLIVRDTKDEVIGPNVNMHWIKNMKPIDDDMKLKLKSKKKAAAWFASNCFTRSGRENFVKDVQKHLQPFNLTVDVYGTCGPLSCPRDKMEDCFEMLKKDYYFYFSLENSFSEDYVTEKLVYGLQYDTVPVVYGGANYTRFMPDGIYLNGRDLGPKKLARTMYEIIQDPERYYGYFKYKNHYKYSYRNNRNDTNDYCGFCALLNDERRVRATTVYKHFRDWWNPKLAKRCEV